MMKALVPEIWPPPSQFHRPCQGSPFIHPATEHSPEMYYDTYGYCDPSMPATTTTTITQVVEKTPSWVFYLLAGGVAFLAWKYLMPRPRSRVENPRAYRKSAWSYEGDEATRRKAGSPYYGARGSRAYASIRRHAKKRKKPQSWIDAIFGNA